MFQCLGMDSRDEEIHDEDDNVNLKYFIKLFGRTMEGMSVSVTIRNFPPYFYIKVDDYWCAKTLEKFRKYLKKFPYFYNDIIGYKIVGKKDLWGFTNFKKFKFIRLSF